MKRGIGEYQGEDAERTAPHKEGGDKEVKREVEVEEKLVEENAGRGER